MTDLEADYRQAGFSSRLGYGVAPALLVVDAVRAYTEPDSPLFLKTGESALDAMVQLLASAREHAVPVAYTAIVVESPADAPLFFKKVPALRLFHTGSPLGEIPGRIAPREGEALFEKRYASAFFGTTLASWLSHQRADTVLVAGFSTSGCVRASALDAMQHGFRPIVVREAVGDRDPAPHEANLFDLDAKYADVVRLSEALEYLQAYRAG